MVEGVNFSNISPSKVDDPSKAPLNSSGSASPGAIYKEFLKKKFGVSGTDYDAAMNTPVSEQALLAAGINPASATSDQIQRATSEIRLGRDLGLTPDQVKQAMYYQGLGSENLRKALDDPTSKINDPLESSKFDSLSASTKIEKKTATEQMLVIGPPHPKMSISNFIAALVRAIQFVMEAKAKVQMADSLTNLNRLQDLLTMTEQRIKHADASTALQVQSLRDTIKTMFAMRVLMYTVMALALAITLALGAMAIVATGGGAAPLVVAAITLMVVAMAAAITSFALTIAASERKRKGQSSLLSETGMTALTYSLMAIEIVGSLASLGVGLMAKAAAQAAAKAAAMAASKASETAVKEAVKSVGRVVQQVTQETLKEAAKKANELASTLVKAALSQGGAAVSQTMGLRQAFNLAALEAESNARNDFNNGEGPNTQKQNAKEKKEKTDQVEQQYQNKGLTTDERAQALTRIENSFASKDISNLSAMISSYKKEAVKREETLGWIMMGVSLAFSFASIGAGVGGGASSLSADAAKKIQQLTKVISALQTTVSVTSSTTQAAVQIQYQEAQIRNIHESAEVKKVIIMLEGIKEMYETLQANAEELMSTSQDSMKKSVEALSSTFDSYSSAIGAFTNKI